jgi:phosphosulfolactate phosphohydrolase-like enzyme
LRSVIIGNVLHLIPSTKAMAYILNNGCKEIHTVAQIREIIAVKQNLANLT